MREFDKTKKILPKNFSGDGVFLEDDAFETVRQFNHQKYYIFPGLRCTRAFQRTDFLYKETIATGSRAARQAGLRQYAPCLT